MTEGACSSKKHHPEIGASTATLVSVQRNERALKWLVSSDSADSPDEVAQVSLYSGLHRKHRLDRCIVSQHRLLGISGQGHYDP